MVKTHFVKAVRKVPAVGDGERQNTIQKRNGISIRRIIYRGNVAFCAHIGNASGFTISMKQLLQILSRMRCCVLLISFDNQ